MERVLEGVKKFEREVYPQHQELFSDLATSQSPRVLFITCADSRVVPDMITQSKPGDLFICRNAGNMVPPVGALIKIPVHPRACGEHWLVGTEVLQWLGSSPRLRGTCCYFLS